MLVKDPEASAWRKEHKAEVESQIQRFLDKAYRRSQSWKSAQNKYCGIAVFCGWQRKLPREILDDIRSGRSNPYRLLDDFVTYLVRDAKTAPHTTKNYQSAVKRWLRFEDVEISTDKLREIVELPRQYSITRDRAPTKQELRDVVVASKPRGRALIMVLASSGMRISEALSLRVGDIEFEKKPTVIDLRAEVTKDRQERYCFISEEATEMLLDYLKGRASQKDWFVFLSRHAGLNESGDTYRTRRREEVGKPIENKPISYWDAQFIFTTALKNVGLTEKDAHGRARFISIP